MSSPGPIKLLRTVPTFSGNTTDTTITGAPLDSPAFTGNPTAPTPTAGDDSTSIATTHFVDNAIDAAVTGTVGALAKINGAASVASTDLTGDVTTSGTPACTVVKIQGKSVDSTAPKLLDIFEYGASASWNIAPPHVNYRGYKKTGNSTSISSQGYYGINTASGLINSTGATPVQVAATATEPAALTLGTSNTASTLSRGSNEAFAANGTGSFGVFRRWSQRARANQTTNTRYWFGMFAQAANVEGTATLATDTPAIALAAFRYSSTTDSVWKAVTSDGSTQNTQSTGVSVDTTNSQLFDITWDGTTVRFYINGSLVASSAVNLPTTTAQIYACLVSDNKNTANASTFNWVQTFIFEKF